MATLVRLRSNDSDVRTVDSWLRDLGYELVSNSNGRYRYEQEGFAPYVLHVTPSDRQRWLANSRAQLRRRHPDAPMFQHRKSAAPKRRRLSRKRRQVPVSLLTVEPMELAIEQTEVHPYPHCTDCGRRWWSDLDFTFRDCPACGGAIRGGQDA